MKKMISTALLAVLCGMSLSAYAQKPGETGAEPMNNGATRKDRMGTADSLPAAGPRKPETGAIPAPNPANRKDRIERTDATSDRLDFAKMDTNGDGLVTRAEYMKYHEGYWHGMKKNPKGSLVLKDMDKSNGPQ